ncbi:MAG: polyprenyl synthetase family protein [Lachnospiraceae bacterium]|nr:polyprenyl synthetase family protein [Lachnospiraceae bacterium]
MDALQERTEEITRIIEGYLPKEEGFQKTVLAAMNYSVSVGGKRLRPLLMQETYRLFGGDKKTVEPFMAALEMIHTYSLVHDDLPAMDNDMLRRGKPTTHAVYGEAMAILAGDGLLNYAFETALLAFDAEPENPYIPRALKVLSEKAGIYGMIGGQVADVEAEKKNLSIDEEKLNFILEKKTAALLEAAMMIGAILAGADERDVQKIETIARNIGVAFQIQDDILDIVGDEAVLGKPIGSDERNEKSTYVAIHGMEESRARVESLTQEAIRLLSELPGDGAFLKTYFQALVYRNK